MAIEVVFYVLVARKSEIDGKYPGGIEQFRFDWGSTSLEDEHLLAYSDMGSDPRDDVATALREYDIDVFRTDSLEWIREHIDWLECQKIGSCCFIWLRGSEPGDLEFFSPDGYWTPHSRKVEPEPETERRWWQFW